MLPEAGGRTELEEAPCLRADERGYGPGAKVEPDVYAWVRLDVTRATTWTALPRPCRGLGPRGRSRGADVTWRCATTPAGPGFFICGDAGTK